MYTNAARLTVPLGPFMQPARAYSGVYMYMLLLGLGCSSSVWLLGWISTVVKRVVCGAAGCRQVCVW
jgi:hypothetical protein